ncbi:MAG: DNA polymerase, partial [Peptoniphilaceae bacterium]|nr:DNA polymerase [Peptoniphilaceae bacterium]MDY5766574.1 DNA polymerase [Peptoniphilaceae bacterium]
HAKAVNFGIIYGISDFGLSQDLGISRAEAKAYIEGYKDTYPSIREYMTRIVEKAHEQGYVETAFGRRRNIPELKSRNYSIRSFGERVALNTPIQGTAADVIKMAMLQVDHALRETHSRARLVLQVHDELILEAPEDEAEEIGELVVQIMQSIGNFAVPLIADMKIGKSWFETK